MNKQMNKCFEAVERERERAILYTTRKITIQLNLLDRKIGFDCYAIKNIIKTIEMIGYKEGTKN